MVDDGVQVGSFWSLRGTHGELTVEVTDVVDGPTSVVMYNITDPYHEASVAMASESAFVERYEPIYPDGL